MGDREGSSADDTAPRRCSAFRAGSVGPCQISLSLPPLSGECRDDSCRRGGSELRTTGLDASALPVSPRDQEASWSLGLFLLPGGRPRRFGPPVFKTVIHAGGLPLRRWPEVAARRSRLRMAISSCSRSPRSSAIIVATSITKSYPIRSVCAGLFRAGLVRAGC